MSNLKESYTCALKLSVDIIGGKWKLVILWHLIEKEKRFSDLRRELPGITQKMLTQQLRELEAADIIVRKVYPVVPPKVEYYLTDYGQSLIPVLMKLCDWSTEYAVHHNIQMEPS